MWSAGDVFPKNVGSISFTKAATNPHGYQKSNKIHPSYIPQPSPQKVRSWNGRGPNSSAPKSRSVGLFADGSASQETKLEVLFEEVLNILKAQGRGSFDSTRHPAQSFSISPFSTSQRTFEKNQIHHKVEKKVVGNQSFCWITMKPPASPWKTRIHCNWDSYSHVFNQDAHGGQQQCWPNLYDWSVSWGFYPVFVRWICCWCGVELPNYGWDLESTKSPKIVK